MQSDLGKIIKIPHKLIKGDYEGDLKAIKRLAKHLKNTKKNLIPVAVQMLDEENYIALHNLQILAAVKDAGLDFVWCVIVDDELFKQVLIESGENFKVAIADASEEEILEALKLAQTKIGSSIIKPQKATKAIIKQREKGKLLNLNFLAKEKCGIGKVTISKLDEFLTL
ncbi:MAG: hypothetical protein F6K35_20215 [Okeania sp. SIO2H7]|nr:hypothetical protein [Okeania sp. SIO2H7]